MGIQSIAGQVLSVGGINTSCCCDPPTNPCEPDPPIKVTLTWTDSDTTKNYVGETFTNGETRVICPDIYQCANNSREYWRKSANTMILSAGLRSDGEGNTTATVHALNVNGQGTGYLSIYASITPGTGAGLFTTSNNLASDNINGNNFLVSSRYILDAQFGQLTDTTGVTVKWTRFLAGEWNAC